MCHAVDPNAKAPKKRLMYKIVARVENGRFISQNSGFQGKRTYWKAGRTVHAVGLKNGYTKPRQFQIGIVDSTAGIYVYERRPKEHEGFGVVCIQVRQRRMSTQ